MLIIQRKGRGEGRSDLFKERSDEDHDPVVNYLCVMKKAGKIGTVGSMVEFRYQTTVLGSFCHESEGTMLI